MAHCAHHLLTALPTPLLIFIRDEFQLSYTRASFVTSTFALANGTGQLPAGFLADRIGPRILLMVGIIGVAGAGILVGISQTYIMLLVFLVLMGLLAGGYHPASAPMISSAVEPNQRGRALGFHLIGGNAGFALAPIIGAAIAAKWDWRASFIGMAIPTVIFGLIFFVFLTRQYGKMRADSARNKLTEDKPPPPGNVRRLIVFLTMSVLGGGTSMSVTSFLALYAHDILGISEQTASSLLTILFTAGVLASPLGGYISDRVGRLPIIITCSLISGILVFSVQFASLGVTFGAILLLMGINNAFRMPSSEAFIMAQTSSRYRSTIYGVYYFTMQYTGAVFAPIMGYLIDHPASGFNNGFAFCFTIAGTTTVIVTLICSLFLRGSQE